MFLLDLENPDTKLPYTTAEFFEELGSPTPDSDIQKNQINSDGVQKKIATKFGKPKVLEKNYCKKIDLASETELVHCLESLREASGSGIRIKDAASEYINQLCQRTPYTFAEMKRFILDTFHTEILLRPQCYPEICDPSFSGMTERKNSKF